MVKVRYFRQRSWPRSLALGLAVCYQILFILLSLCPQTEVCGRALKAVSSQTVPTMLTMPLAPGVTFLDLKPLETLLVRFTLHSLSIRSPPWASPHQGR